MKIIKKVINCLFCKKQSTAKYCSEPCERKAREQFGRIISNLKTEKRPWGEKVVGKSENEI